MEFKQFSQQYIVKLHQTLNKIDLDEFEKFFNLLNKIEARVFIIGNGGSSATASHMANDLSVGLKKKNIKRIDAISLSENSAVSFAIANDLGFENIFYMQVKDVIKAEDVLIAISCSGNSPNIIKAVEYSKSINSTIVGFTGFDGGKLKELSDIKIHIDTKKDDYGLVEDIHLVLNHIIYSYFLKCSNE